MIATRKSLAKLHLRNAMGAKVASRGRGRPKRIPRAVPPHAIEREWVGHLLALARQMAELYKRALIPRLGELVRGADAAHERADAYTDTLAEVLQFIARSLGTLTSQPAAASQARAIFDRVNAHAKAQVEGQVQVVAGVPIASVLPGGQEMADGFVANNVSLIRSIGQTQHDQVEQVVRKGLTNGLRPEALEQEIRERFIVSESRAELIARDQVLKAFGQVTEARHKALGIDGFIWRTSKDERVRGNPRGKYPPRKGQHNHWELEGRSFKYGSAPFGGPGQDYQCRCTAEPDVSELLAD